MMTITGHELRLNTKTILVWASTIGLCIFVFMLLYPPFKSQSADIDKMFAGMGQFSVAFGMDKISIATPIGFYGIQDGVMLSLGGAMFAAMIGIGMLSKEEGNHTAEFLFTSSESRGSILIQKWLAAAAAILIFDTFCLACGVLSFYAIGEELLWKELLLFHLAQLIMHLEIGSICFGISAFLKKNNVGLGIGIASLLYFLNMFINFSEKLDGLKYITPFHYSDAVNIFSSVRIGIPEIAAGICIGAAVCIVGSVHYVRRDLSA